MNRSNKYNQLLMNKWHTNLVLVHALFFDSSLLEFSIFVMNRIKEGRPFDAVVIISYDESINKLLDAMSIEEFFQRYTMLDKDLVSYQRVEIQYGQETYNSCILKTNKKPLKIFIFTNLYGYNGAKIELPYSKNQIRVEIALLNNQIIANVL